MFPFYDVIMYHGFTEIMTWKRYHYHDYLWDVITRQCPKSNGYLTHYGLVTSYGDIELGQHWLR